MAMIKKIKEKRRKILRNVLAFLSFSTAVFAFQACYGTPKDFGLDVLVQGVVKSKKTNLPIQGIKVSIVNQPEYEYTDVEGKYTIFTSGSEALHVRFEDIDSTKNGYFFQLDTTLARSSSKTVTLNVDLNAR